MNTALGLCDTTFSDYDEVVQRLAKERPFAIGIYTNLMTRKHVLAIMGMAKKQGCMVILGGPEAANYADEYLQHGADHDAGLPLCLPMVQPLGVWP